MIPPSRFSTPPALPLAGGTLIKQLGCVHSGMLGGWVLDRSSATPLLMTAAHLLRPMPEIFARPAKAPPLPPVLDLGLDGPLLRTTADPSPAALVVRTGVADPRRQPASLDVALAAPLSDELVPSAALDRGTAPPRIGQRVAIAGAPANLGKGIVVATGWPSRHYGACNDVLVAAAGGATFSAPGMSGAWVLDEASGLPVGMLVGEVYGIVLPGLPAAPLACLHPIADILALFDATLG